MGLTWLGLTTCTWGCFSKLLQKCVNIARNTAPRARKKTLHVGFTYVWQQSITKFYDGLTSVALCKDTGNVMQYPAFKN